MYIYIFIDTHTFYTYIYKNKKQLKEHVVRFGSGWGGAWSFLYGKKRFYADVVDMVELSSGHGNQLVGIATEGTWVSKPSIWGWCFSSAITKKRLCDDGRHSWSHIASLEE